MFVLSDLLVYCCWMLPLSLCHAPSHARRLVVSVRARLSARARARVCVCVCLGPSAPRAVSLCLSRNKIASVNLNTWFLFWKLFHQVGYTLALRSCIFLSPSGFCSISAHACPRSGSLCVALSRCVCMVCVCVWDALHCKFFASSRPQTSWPQTLPARSSHTLCFTQLISALLRELISRALIPVRPLAGCVSRSAGPMSVPIDWT